MRTSKTRPNSHKTQVFRKIVTNLVKAIRTNEIQPITHLFLAVFPPSPRPVRRLIYPILKPAGHIMKHLKFAKKGPRPQHSQHKHSSAIDDVDLRLVDEVDSVGILACWDDSLEIFETFHM